MRSTDQTRLRPCCVTGCGVAREQFARWPHSRDSVFAHAHEQRLVAAVSAMTYRNNVSILFHSFHRKVSRISGGKVQEVAQQRQAGWPEAGRKL